MRSVNLVLAVLLTVFGFTAAPGLPLPTRPQSVSATTDRASDVFGQRPGATSPAAISEQAGLRRIIAEAGRSLPLQTDSGGFIVYTESGTWTFLVTQGASRVSRAPVADNMSSLPGPLIANSALGYGPELDPASVSDDLTIGSEVTLTAGDVLFIDGWGEASVNMDATSALLVLVEIDSTCASLTDPAPTAVAIPAPGN